MLEFFRAVFTNKFSLVTYEYMLVGQMQVYHQKIMNIAYIYSMFGDVVQAVQVLVHTLDIHSHNYLFSNGIT